MYAALHRRSFGGHKRKAIYYYIEVGFFIYGINSLVWAFATDVGGRIFGGTAAGILDCAAYIGASVQAIYFGGVLTNSGNWNWVFLCIVGVLAVMVVAAVLAGVKRK